MNETKEQEKPEQKPDEPKQEQNPVRMWMDEGSTLHLELDLRRMSIHTARGACMSVSDIAVGWYQEVHAQRVKIAKPGMAAGMKSFLREKFSR